MPVQRFAFVLRIWLEHNPHDREAPPVLRGSIQPVDAELVYYVSSLDEIPYRLRVLIWPDQIDPSGMRAEENSAP